MEPAAAGWPRSEDRVLDGPASGEKGSKGEPSATLNPKSGRGSILSAQDKRVRPALVDLYPKVNRPVNCCSSRFKFVVSTPERSICRTNDDRKTLFRAGCEDPRPHAWSLCAACLCHCISLSRATPLGRSCYQTSEFPTTSEFPAELPTHTAVPYSEKAAPPPRTTKGP